MGRRTGSSPRGRGKPVKLLLRGARHGLIPAWAGKTRICDLGLVFHAAHPRVGGENDVRVARRSRI